MGPSLWILSFCGPILTGLPAFRSSSSLTVLSGVRSSKNQSLICTCTRSKKVGGLQR